MDSLAHPTAKTGSQQQPGTSEFDFVQALLSYTSAIQSQAQEQQQQDTQDGSVAAQRQAENNATLIQLLMNRSFVNLSLQRFSPAIDDATRAVDLCSGSGGDDTSDPNRDAKFLWQALLKRARALACVGKFAEALCDVQRATGIQPLAVFPLKRDLELIAKMRQLPSANPDWQQPEALRRQLQLQHEHTADYCCGVCCDASAAAANNACDLTCVCISNPVEQAVFSYVKRKATSTGCKASVAQLFDLLGSRVDPSASKKDDLRRQLASEFGFDPLIGHGMMSLVQVGAKKQQHEELLKQKANPSFVHFCARPNLFAISESSRFTHGASTLFPSAPKWIDNVADFLARARASGVAGQRHVVLDDSAAIIAHVEQDIERYRRRKEQRKLAFALNRVLGITKDAKAGAGECCTILGMDATLREKCVAGLSAEYLLPFSSAPTERHEATAAPEDRLPLQDALFAAIERVQSRQSEGWAFCFNATAIFESLLDPPPQCANVRCAKLLLMEDPPECQCGANYCSLECFRADFAERHQRECLAFASANPLFVSLNATFWDCVSVGVFRWTGGPKAPRGSRCDAETTEFDACMDVEKEELSNRIVEVQRYCRHRELGPAETANYVAQELVQQHRALSTPLPTDSLARLTFKLIAVKMVFSGLAGIFHVNTARGRDEEDDEKGDAGLPVESIERTMQKFKFFLDQKASATVKK